MLSSRPEGDNAMSYRTEGGISVHPWGQGLSKGRQAGKGVAGGLEQGGWGLGRVSKGPGRVSKGLGG